MNNGLIENLNYWENRKLYRELMEDFMSGKITGTQFNRDFCQMWRIDRDRNSSFEELVDKIDEVKLDKFATLMSSLFIDCDAFEPNASLREDFEISEEEFKNCVKETLLEMKKLYS